MSTEVATQKRVVEDDSAISYLMDTARFEHLYRVANMLGRSALTPKHLKGASQEETAANCFRVVNQAVRWGLDPFAVADESYVVSGKLGYQGKLVATVVNSRAGLRERLRATYAGRGDDLTVTIVGRFRNESEDRTITLSVRQGKTANKMWSEDPEQKLWYSGVTKWARRHCPEVLMGVLTEDDLERATERFVEATVIPSGTRTENLAAMLASDGGPTTDDLAGNIIHEPEAKKGIDPLSLVRGAIAKARTPEAVDAIVADEMSGPLTEEEKSLVYAAGEDRKAILKGGAK